ncbi:LolA family protein [Kosmotoga olearia]|jgi:outer membrane lipoprotein-sorting protein|uniref:Outer membrane lipoprotein-sorting protein n=1 Tax=Kosmotoga olearia (strain ATCC BAA-1733 / DSM 21960 / TBF 19.5.1) TaxID=521045 RepID=C5CIC2_KOSOT|nr:hypothetical protein [Kosmotoga olearia]ACR78856.1 hypothetical protein Kole_0130 [Kosmotoga olearia TBF 19.5.1]
MRKFKMVTGLFLVMVIVASAVLSVSLNDILVTSENMKTIKCVVNATKFSKRSKSQVEFLFYFNRDGQKLRIEYTAPRNMKGSIVAIDGEYFYNYISSLKRTMKKELSGDFDKNKAPGRDMGIFFDFVYGDLDRVFSNMQHEYIGEETLKINKKEVNTYHYVFQKADEKQEVWFDSETLAPVKIVIYQDGKKVYEIFVFDIQINITLEDSLFRL